MAFLRKIKAGLVKTDIETFVGEEGNLFFDVETGEIKISDGATPGGIAVSGGGGGSGYTLPTASTTVKGGVKVDGTTITISNQIISGFDGNYNSLINKPTIPLVPTNISAFTNDAGYLTTIGIISYNDITDKPTIPSMTVSLIDGTNTVSNSLTNITAIRFDTESGFDIIDLGSGAVKIGMNSTFKTWKVDGQNDLIANGLDTIEFIAGSGLVITTDPLGDPKSITFKTVDKTVTLYQDGVLESILGTVRWYNPSNVTVSKITARLAETSSQPVTVNIRKSGTVVETLTFSALQNKTTKTVGIPMIVDDYLTVDIATNGGTGLSVEFTYNFE